MVNHAYILFIFYTIESIFFVFDIVNASNNLFYALPHVYSYRKRESFYVNDSYKFIYFIIRHSV